MNNTDAGAGSGITKLPCGAANRTIVPGATPPTRWVDRKPSGMAFTVMVIVREARPDVAGRAAPVTGLDVNDVLLTVVAGALRNWLMSRGEPVTATTTVRAMAPMSVYPDADLDTTGPGQAISEVSPFLIDLPVGEGNAVVRLSQIAHTTESLPTAASLVDARTIVTLSGFAPPTLHAMGIRVATSFSARLFNLLITNVPGAQKQMFLAGTKLLETYAVPPLLNNQVLAIGVTSYNGMPYRDGGSTRGRAAGGRGAISRWRHAATAYRPEFRSGDRGRDRL